MTAGNKDCLCSKDRVHTVDHIDSNTTKNTGLLGDLDFETVDGRLHALVRREEFLKSSSVLWLDGWNSSPPTEKIRLLVRKISQKRSRKTASVRGDMAPLTLAALREAMLRRPERKIIATSLGFEKLFRGIDGSIRGIRVPRIEDPSWEDRGIEDPSWLDGGNSVPSREGPPSGINCAVLRTPQLLPSYGSPFPNDPPHQEFLKVRDWIHFQYLTLER